MLACHATASRPCRRLAAALALSAFAHALFSVLLKPGTAGRSAAVYAARIPFAISVRIALPEPQLPSASPDSEHDIAAQAAPLPGRSKRERPASPVNIGPPKGPSAGPAEIRDPTYYPARELDVYPALAAALDLRPLNDARDDLKGRALLLVLIDAQGLVDEVSVVEPGPAAQFDEAAKHALREARFTPALKHGRAVRSRILVNIAYGPE
jgi:periplasmic protein TonB